LTGTWCIGDAGCARFWANPGAAISPVTAVNWSNQRERLDIVLNLFI
jgi:hypothetical protein